MNRKRQRIDPLAAMAAANPASPTELAAEIGEVDLERALARAVALGREPSQPTPAVDRVATELGRVRGRAPGVFGTLGIGTGRRRATLGLG
ncbi:MAG: hypothetical protein WBM00_12810, partial [Solirubrobacterales bacterium]